MLVYFRSVDVCKLCSSWHIVNRALRWSPPPPLPLQRREEVQFGADAVLELALPMRTWLFASILQVSGCGGVAERTMSTRAETACRTRDANVGRSEHE